MEFANRIEAGRLLAKKLDAYANRSDVVVLALPRGGVPVAYEVAHALNAPLDIFLVRKLGVPGKEELAMGAIATGGVRMMNRYVVRSLGISDRVIDEVVAQELRAPGADPQGAVVAEDNVKDRVAGGIECRAR